MFHTKFPGQKESNNVHPGSAFLSADNMILQSVYIIPFKNQDSWVLDFFLIRFWVYLYIGRNKKDKWQVEESIPVWK